MEQLFSLSGLLVMPFWGLMMLLPAWRWTRKIIESPLIAVAPALLYAALVIPELATVLPAVMNPNLGGIAALLATPAGATIGWVHFLAFDLFVGRWIYLDSRERGIHALLISPILFLTLMLGPCGFLTYLAVRALAQRVSGSAPAAAPSLKEAAQ
ncbi:MAG TPA: ABA4-like family protein [Herpetosiphonaceae bacterium]